MSSGSGAPAPENADSDAAFSVKKSSSDLLRHVLEATLARGAGEMSPDELQKLQVIAREHSEPQVDMEQIAQRLVASLLSTRFPDLANPDSNRLMCERIAASLCGDPTSMQRLKILWNQLRQSVT